MTSAQFEYAPLPTDSLYIRLLQFEGRTPDGRLSFSLIAHKLSGILPYNAVSYERGKGDASIPVVIQSRPFFIGKNLHDCLSALSSSQFKSTALFTDTICINQNDIPEWHSQTQHMHLVYAHAENVLAWLGLASPESDLIFDLCATAADNLAEATRGGAMARAMKHYDPEGKALATIYRRSYWTRLWIIQELYLAKQIDFFCGNKSVPWSLFRKLHVESRPRSTSPKQFRQGTHQSERRLVSRPFPTTDHVPKSSAIERHARALLDELDTKEDEYFKNMRLHEIILKFGRAMCSDVRDRVFGLLSVTNPDAWIDLQAAEKQEDRIIADYSMSPAALYISLLMTLPRELSMIEAKSLFNILKLHTELGQFNEDFMDRIPDTVLLRKFEIEIEDIGRLAEEDGLLRKEENIEDLNSAEGLPVCGQATSAKFPPNTRLWRIIPSSLCVLDSFNSDPTADLCSYRHCVTTRQVSSEYLPDQVFILPHTRLVFLASTHTNPTHDVGVLVCREDVTGGCSITGQWGVLSRQKDSESILEAEKVLEYMNEHFPAAPKGPLVAYESTVSRYELVMEMDLGQVTRILARACIHSTYWDVLDE